MDKLAKMALGAPRAAIRAIAAARAASSFAKKELLEKPELAQMEQGGLSCTMITDPNKKEPNQDVVGMGMSTNANFLRNPKEYLQSLAAKAASTLSEDERFYGSGTTCNVTALIGRNLHVLAFGDSPTCVSIVDTFGKRVTFQLSIDDKFSKRRFGDKFAISTDSMGVNRHDGLSVVCLGHNRNKSIAEVGATFRTFDLGCVQGMVEMIGGIKGEVIGIDLFVASDGIGEADYSGDRGSSVVQALTPDYQVAEVDGRMQFPKVGYGDTISQTLSLEGPKYLNYARCLVGEAKANGSKDNLTIAHLSLKGEELQNILSNIVPQKALTFGGEEFSKIPDAAPATEARLAFVCDGNGPNGHLAAGIVRDIICSELELQVMLKMPLYLPSIVPTLSPEAAKVASLHDKDAPQQTH